MTAPVRLQLSRRKGFSLQAHSRAVNGLPAIMVTRPHSVFQNRWKVGVWSNRLGKNLETAAEAVACFVNMMEEVPHLAGYARERLSGSNLACWCGLCVAHKKGKPLGAVCTACAPCHADFLIELSNAER
jgi:hypothetical protein